MENPAKKAKTVKNGNARRWAFTTFVLNEDGTAKEPVCDQAAIIANLKKIKGGVTRYSFQLEKSADGKMHYQGRAAFKQSHRVTALRDAFATHWSIESDAKGSTFYTMDPEKREDGPWTDKTERKVVSQALMDMLCPKELYSWQKDVVEYVGAQNKRQITMVIDRWGQSGKGALGNWMEFNMSGMKIPSTMASAEDILQFVMSSIEDDDDMKEHLFILDVPRSMETNKKWASWFAAMETLKDGYIYDKRYKRVSKRFRPPKILVFSNDYPPTSGLSVDRWNLLFMKHNTDLIKVSPFMIKEIEAKEASAKQAGRYTYKSRMAGDTEGNGTLDQISFETDEAELANGGVYQMSVVKEEEPEENKGDEDEEIEDEMADMDI